MRIVAAAFAVLLLARLDAFAADVTIGALYPQGDARDAIATALDIVNGAHERVPVLMGQGGGLDRLGGARLLTAFADDGGDPAQATAAAERLVSQDGAVALIGGTTDATAGAISRVAEAHGIPFLALNSALTNKDGLEWFFRLGRTQALDARGILKLLAAIAADRGKPLHTIAFSGGDDIAPLRAAAGPAGLDVIDGQGGGTPDLVVSSAGAASAPGAVVLAAPGGTAPSADGVFRAIGFSPEPFPARPGLDPVGAAYQARSGKGLTTTTAREITGVLLLADVINRAASTKPLDLRTALMATDTPGSETLMLWDGIRFDDSGQNVLATPGLQQMQGGAWKTVAPEGIATAPPVWPGSAPR